MELRCLGRCCLVNRCLLVSADYSQIEMRVLAHLCRDPVLLDLFRHEQDYDIYRQLAGKIFNRPVSAVTAEERDRAKVVCLGERYGITTCTALQSHLTLPAAGVIYGMGAQATASKLGIAVAQASRITQSFFDHFRQMRSWIQQIKRCEI
jgi:DNA polymerase-1